MVSTRSSSRAASAVPETLPPIPATPSTTRRAKRTTTTTATPSNRKRAASSAVAWQHRPAPMTLLWLAISLPLVAWDTGYVLLRPLSMEGGSLHWPLWVPYRLYGETDLIYGWKAFNSKNGFTGAQSFMNIIESLLYVLYLAIVLNEADRSLDASGKARRSLSGRSAARAVLVGFSAAVMTFSKTLLYWACEYYSGFDNVGHNSAQDLLVLWIIPNGAWLVLPAYMIYVFGNEILDGLAPPEHTKSK